MGPPRRSVARRLVGYELTKHFIRAPRHNDHCAALSIGVVDRLEGLRHLVHDRFPLVVVQQPAVLGLELVGMPSQRRLPEGRLAVGSARILRLAAQQQGVALGRHICIYIVSF